jgi:hypothetical protein
MNANNLSCSQTMAQLKHWVRVDNLATQKNNWCAYMSLLFANNGKIETLVAC